MKRKKIIVFFTVVVGIVMISVGVFSAKTGKNFLKKTTIKDFELEDIVTSVNTLFNEEKTKKEEPEESAKLTEVAMEVTPSSIVIPPRIEVYEGMTLEEVAAQLDKTLKNDIAGKGIVIASKSIELGVDPFVATAIMMHETGCGQRQCSSLARNCYNFGGQKGKGCGAYKRYNSIDEGLEGIIYNLYKNYYAMGLNTVEKIGPKYAESTTWAQTVNWYVNKIKNA